MFNREGQLHGTHRSQLWEWLQRHTCKPLPGRWWMCISPSVSAPRLWLHCWLLCWSVVAPGSGDTETEAWAPSLIVCLGMFFFVHLRFRVPYKSIQRSFLRLLPSSTHPAETKKKKKIKIKVSLHCRENSPQWLPVTCSREFIAHSLFFIASGKAKFSTHCSLQTPYLCNSVVFLPPSLAFSFQQLIFIPDAVPTITSQPHWWGFVCTTTQVTLSI